MHTVTVAVAFLALLSVTSTGAAESVAQIPSLCDTCLLSVKLLDDALSDADATNFLVDLVEKNICNVIGDNEKCHNLAEGLLPVIIQFLRASATPAAMCSLVCDSKVVDSTKLNKPLLSLEDDDLECSLCKYVGGKVQAAAEAAEYNVEVVAHQACSKLPTELQDACNKFVNKYEIIIESFIQSVDVDQLCVMTGTCPAALAVSRLRGLPASTVKAMRPMMLTLTNGGPTNDACDVCKMAVIEAHSLVANPEVQKDMAEYTKAICASLPLYVEECKVYVDQYAPVAFALLEQYLVPDVLCSSAGVCPAVTAKGGAAVVAGGGRKALLPGRTLDLSLVQNQRV